MPRSAANHSDDDETIARALDLLHRRLQHRQVFARAGSVKEFLLLHAHALDHEVFAIMFLDSHRRLIAYERLFRGTLTHTIVHPREVVKRALARNAAAVILHHNHPGGSCMPTVAALELTRSLARTLALVEVTVLDHVFSTETAALSMAERGMM